MHDGQLAPPTIEGPPGSPRFLVHNEGDQVGVAVQDVEPGPAECVYMDSDRTITIDVAEHIPLGHKVALEKLAEGVDVVEYGVRIGLTRNAIEAGHWAHTHNLRSARWQTSV